MKLMAPDAPWARRWGVPEQYLTPVPAEVGTMETEVSSGCARQAGSVGHGRLMPEVPAELRAARPAVLSAATAPLRGRCHWGRG